jgi:hypothetical protein
MGLGSHPIAGLALGAGLGLLLAEASLRLAFHEHEADRNYWGRGAFVEDPELPFVHAALATAVQGRLGVFGPIVTRTNSAGFRDLREPQSSPADAPAVVVLGASYAFGVGVAETADLFHARLEEGLRQRRDWPDATVVSNLSQTGYDPASLVALLRRERERYRPDVVIALVPRLDNAITQRADVRDGYRLDPDRSLADTPLDWLRTHSFVWMRAVDPSSFGAEAHLFQIRRWLGLGEPAETVSPESEAVVRANLDALAKLAEELAADGVVLRCVTLDQGVAGRIREVGIDVALLPSQRDYYLAGDDHWNETGHAAAAGFVSKRLPSWKYVAERRR